jgi:FkbM family methyltransferase
MSKRKERALRLFLKSNSHSETRNDLWITECIYPGKRDGYFVEAGAAGGKFASSCYVLEARLGWTGICVEPNNNFFQELVENRPHSICEKICLSNQIGQVVFIEGFNELANPYLSGIKSNLEQYKHHSESILHHGREIIKESTTLEALLKKHNAPKIIDYAAFDIEGSELEVFRDFPFDEYQISALSLECDGYIWDAITNLLTSNGYREVKNPFNTDKSWERYWLHENLT